MPDWVAPAPISPSPDAQTNSSISPARPPLIPSTSTTHPTHSRNASRNFSEVDFIDSGLGRALTSELPIVGLQHELDSLHFDDLFVEDYLLSKLQDAQRRLQEVRDLKSVSTYSSPSHSPSHPLASGPTRSVPARPPPPHRLFVASIRLPLTVEIADDGEISSTISRASLGLVSAFKDLSARTPIRWLGAPGQTFHDAATLPDHHRRDLEFHFRNTRHHNSRGLLSYVPLFPDLDEASAHQEFCNSVLWPLFHYIPFNLGERHYSRDMFTAYVRVNRFYANALIDEWRKSGVDEADAIFWVHDFHLCLVPKMLRDILPNARIGFFLYVPFPTPEVFRAVAPRKEILEGLLGADLLGFHTYDYARHFLTTCQRLLGLRTRPDAVINKGLDVQIGIFPFGIDPDTFTTAINHVTVKELTTQLKESLVGKKVVLGVDRLDYIKGIPHKLLAIEHFLENHPEWIGRVVFLQVATTSSSFSEEYDIFRNEILEMVGRINGRFATIEDMPIHYRELSVTLEELCALYAGADVAIITSLRDGMNLVSYEYIMCQKDLNGVLILSEFAGAAKNLPGAVLINPWDVEEVSDAIFQSLEMSELEREMRHQKLYRHVVKHTAAQWGVSFVDDLIKHSSIRREKAKLLVEMPIEDVLLSYRAAMGKRLFLLDYDGTIRKYESQPELAEPRASLKATLKALVACEDNIVFILTGRQKSTMLEWFGDIGIGFAVEHGFSIRWPDHLRARFGGRKNAEDDEGNDGDDSQDSDNVANRDKQGSLDKNRLVGETVAAEMVDAVVSRATASFSSDSIPFDAGTSVSVEGPIDGDDEDGYSFRKDETWDDLLESDDLSAMRNTLKIAGSYLREVEESTPSSFLSQKESGYSWFFRDADPTFAQMREQEARQTLEEKLAGSRMEVLRGNMILYVRPRGVHKGAVVADILRRLTAEGETPSWIFSIGDDCTDEDMFVELARVAKENKSGNANSKTSIITCTVGRKQTAANYFLSGVDDVLCLLEEMVQRC